MNILHVSFTDLYGGASIASFRLNEAFNRYKLNEEIELHSFLLVQEKFSDDDNVYDLGKLDRHIYRKIRIKRDLKTKKRYSTDNGLFSFFESGADISRNPLVTGADIIYLHWINMGFINFKALKKILALGKPVYWFCHDMFPITGGCHHSYECLNYTKKEGCLECGYFNDSGNNIAPRFFKQKRRIYSEYGNLRFVTPSNWLKKCAEGSCLTNGHLVHKIPNTIDINTFVPMEKKSCKRLFGIEKSRKVIAFGATEATENKYKGFSYLTEALGILKKRGHDDITILLFGTKENDEIRSLLPFSVVFAGVLHEKWSLVNLYNASDVLAVPSLAENFPNAIVECLSCNVPVVGFDVGGIPELINDSTGVLCKYKDVEALAEGLEKVLYSDKVNYMGRDYISSLCSYDVIIEKHIEMWKEDGII